MRTRRIRVWLGPLLFALGATPGFAQTGQTAQIPLQFDFLNPGARSLGLGSAFVGVADDATAAFTNPAGLTLILRPEISAEVRYRRLDTTYLASGRLSGTPSGNGLDTVSGPAYGISPDSAVRPSFLSVVYPRGNWSVAAYRHELVMQTNSFISQGPFYRSMSAAGTFDNARLFGLAGDRDIDIVTYGAGVAYHVSSHLSLGGGVALYRFNLNSRFGALGFTNGLFSPADPGTRGQLSTTTQTGTETRAAVDLGALVTISRAVRIGGVFRQSASFRYTQVNVVPSTPTATEIGNFRTPAVLGAGVRVQPTDEWAFAVDYDRVQYSRLTTDFISLQVDPSVVGRVSIADGNELHVGAEYTFVRTASKPALRVGIWFDPDHSVQYASDGSRSDVDTRLKAIFPGGASVWHYCTGFGMPLSRAYEVNVGADFTSKRHYVSASVVARFGK
jgi:long-chain fatty acid transport protein